MTAAVKRQIFQSLWQFASVFFAALLIYPKPPTLEDLWQPFVQAVVAALAIWGGSKIPVGKRAA